VDVTAAAVVDGLLADKVEVGVAVAVAVAVAAVAAAAAAVAIVSSAAAASLADDREGGWSRPTATQSSIRPS
jgi:hypothetical protein